MFNLPANEKRHVQIIKNAIFVTIWEIYLNPKREIGIKITINAMSKYFKEEKLYSSIILYSFFVLNRLNREKITPKRIIIGTMKEKL